MAFKLSLFLAELKRRKVYQVGAVYVVVGLGVIAAAEGILPPLGLEQVQSVVVILVLLGLPIALSLAWAYEVKPEEPRRAEATPAAVVESPESEQRKSIVVLPFDNMSPDPGDAYFADGLTEEIITDLSHLRSLGVISRNSAMVLKGTQKDTRTIGRELGVEYVLEGSVRKAGNSLRITAQLIDAETDQHLWAEKYDGVMDDVFSIQETVSRSIVDAFQIRLKPEEVRRIKEQHFENVQAYECFLRAKAEISRFTKESLQQGIRTLHHCRELFPDNPLITATLGEAYCHFTDAGYETDEDCLNRAQELAEVTLSLDPNSPMGEKLLGFVERGRGNLSQASRHLKRAFDADPDDVGIMLYAASFLSCYAGRFQIADEIFDRLLEIDPLSPINYQLAGSHHYFKGEFDSALALAQKGHEMNPAMPHARLAMGMMLAAGGQIEESLVQFETLLEAGVPEPLAGMARFFKHAVARESEEAVDALDEETTAHAWNDPDWPYVMVGPFALIGRNDLALEWLQRALDRWYINYPFLSATGPFMEQLRGEERFQRMLEFVKTRWEEFEL